MVSNEAKELREQVETLRQQFASYVEAQSATEDIESILAQGADEATADREWRPRQGGKPASLRHSSGRPGRPKLTDAERARRAFQYATKHDAEDIPDLRDRMASLEQQLATVAKAVNNLTVGMGKRGGILGWLTGE